MRSTLSGNTSSGTHRLGSGKLWLSPNDETQQVNNDDDDTTIPTL